MHCVTIWVETLYGKALQSHITNGDASQQVGRNVHACMYLFTLGET